MRAFDRIGQAEGKTPEFSTQIHLVKDNPPDRSKSYTGRRMPIGERFPGLFGVEPGS
jgi:hypothetical protein